MRSLQKRERILLGMVGATAIFFVVDRFVCGEKTPQTPEIVKKTVAEKTIPKPPDTKKAKIRNRIGSFRDRKSGQLIKYSSWGRDPFAEAIRLSQSDSTKSDSSNFVLRGVIWKAGEAHVLIGDDILKSGEQKGDLKILDIGKDRVICKKGGKIVTLVLEDDGVFQ